MRKFILQQEEEEREKKRIEEERRRLEEEERLAALAKAKELEEQRRIEEEEQMRKVCFCDGGAELSINSSFSLRLLNFWHWFTMSLMTGRNDNFDLTI